MAPSITKYNRAKAKSAIGKFHRSFDAMLHAIPDDVAQALTSTRLATLVDANWRITGASKAIALKDAIDAGCIWDERRQKLREISNMAWDDATRTIKPIEA